MIQPSKHIWCHSRGRHPCILPPATITIEASKHVQYCCQFKKPTNTTYTNIFVSAALCRRGSDTAPGFLPEWNALAKKWMAPFVMEIVNSRIVQRSSFLNGCYGSDFKYREAQATNGLIGASLVSSMMVGIGAMMSIGPIRNIAQK